MLSPSLTLIDRLLPALLAGSMWFRIAYEGRADTHAYSATNPDQLSSCGNARAAVMTPLTLGSHQNIVYIVNEYQGHNPTFGTLKRYDVTSGNKTEIIKLPNVTMNDAQISADGQWIVFTSISAGGPNSTASLNQFTQYPSSNFSRDNSMYALEQFTAQNGKVTETLLFGSLHGGSPTTFASISGTELAIVGWTTM